MRIFVAAENYQVYTLTTDGNRAAKRRKISLAPEQAEMQAALVQDNHLLGAWWGAMASNTFIGNGVPPLPSEAISPKSRTRFSSESQDMVRSGTKGKLKSYVHGLLISLRSFSCTAVRSRKPSSSKPMETPGLRGTVYKNIDSLRRIRRTHTALLSVVTTNSIGNDEDAPRRNLQAARKPDAPPLSRSSQRLLKSSADIAHGANGSIPIKSGSKLAVSILQNNCTHLLEHSGFEGKRAFISTVICTDSLI